MACLLEAWLIGWWIFGLVGWLFGWLVYGLIFFFVWWLCLFVVGVVWLMFE